MTEERYREILRGLGSPDDEGGFDQVTEQACESDLSDEELLEFLAHHGWDEEQAADLVTDRRRF